MFELESQKICDEIFKNHVATLTKMDGIQILSFAEPGTKYFSTEFIFKDNKIFVSGDFGTAVFVTTWYPTWDYPWEKTELGYFSEKLRAFDDEKYVIDLEKAEKEVKEWIVEADDWDNPEKIAEDLIYLAYWDDFFEDFEDTELCKEDNSSHLLKVCYKLLNALRNAHSYSEFNNSLTFLLFDSDDLETLRHILPYSNIGMKLNPKIEKWLYMLREAKKQLLGGKICK